MTGEIQDLCSIVDHIKTLDLDSNVKPLVSLMEERNAYQFESLSDENTIEKVQDVHMPSNLGKTLLKLSGENMRDGIYFSAKK